MSDSFETSLPPVAVQAAVPFTEGVEDVGAGREQGRALGAASCFGLGRAREGEVSRCWRRSLRGERLSFRARGASPPPSPTEKKPRRLSGAFAQLFVTLLSLRVRGGGEHRGVFVCFLFSESSPSRQLNKVEVDCEAAEQLASPQVQKKEPRQLSSRGPSRPSDTTGTKAMRHLLRLYSKLRIKNGRKGEREGGGGGLLGNASASARRNCLPYSRSRGSLFLSFTHASSLSLSLSYLSGDQRDERRAAEEKGHGEAARHGVFEGFGKEEEDWSKTSFSVAERK